MHPPPPLQDLLRSGSTGGKGHLVSQGRVDGDKACWIFERLAAEEEQRFKDRAVRRGVVGGVWLAGRRRPAPGSCARQRVLA